MMEKELLDLVAGERTQNRESHELRIISAWELLQARWEAQTMGDEAETEALRRNACILSRAVMRGGGRIFDSGKAVLEQWSAEKIGREIAAYRLLACRVDPGCGQEQQVEKLLSQLKKEPMERIRWKVLKAFGVLPTEARAREMTRGDYLYCALQMMLDREQKLQQLCPACRSRAEEKHCIGCGGALREEDGVNPQFDLQRFEEMKQGG